MDKISNEMLHQAMTANEVWYDKTKRSSEESGGVLVLYVFLEQRVATRRQTVSFYDFLCDRDSQYEQAIIRIAKI